MKAPPWARSLLLEGTTFSSFTLLIFLFNSIRKTLNNLLQNHFLPYHFPFWFIILALSDTGTYACAHLSLVLLSLYSRCIQQCLSGRHFKLNPNSTCCVSEKGGRDRDGDKVLNEGWERAQRVKVSAAQAWPREFEFLSRNSRWKELTPVFSDIYVSCGKCTSILTYAEFLL